MSARPVPCGSEEAEVEVFLLSFFQTGRSYPRPNEGPRPGIALDRGLFLFGPQREFACWEVVRIIHSKKKIIKLSPQLNE
jgi:hypothetical protein